MILIRSLVQKQRGRAVGIEYHDVQVSIIVDVPKRGAPPRLQWQIIEPARIRDFLKGMVIPPILGCACSPMRDRIDRLWSQESLLVPSHKSFPPESQATHHPLVT